MTNLKDLIGLIKLPKGEDSVSIIRKMRDKEDAKPKNPAAVALGKLTSPRKAESSRQNGKKGGRPKTERLHSGKSANADRKEGNHE